MSVGQSHIMVAGTTMDDGTYKDVHWAGDRDLLDELRLQATWDVPVGGQERVRITVFVSDPFETEPLKVLQLPSPVDVVLRVHPDIPRAQTIHVEFGTVDDDLPFGSIALADQRIDLTLTQHYSC